MGDHDRYSGIHIRFFMSVGWCYSAWFYAPVFSFNMSAQHCVGVFITSTWTSCCFTVHREEICFRESACSTERSSSRTAHSCGHSQRNVLLSSSYYSMYGVVDFSFCDSAQIKEWTLDFPLFLWLLHKCDPSPSLTVFRCSGVCLIAKNITFIRFWEDILNIH